MINPKIPGLKVSRAFSTEFHNGVQLGLVEPVLGHDGGGLMGQYPVNREIKLCQHEGAILFGAPKLSSTWQHFLFPDPYTTCWFRAFLEMKRPVLPCIPLSVKTYTARSHMHTQVGWRQPQRGHGQCGLVEWTHRGLLSR